MLRAIGASDISVGWVFIMEGIVNGSLSWFIGCLASFIFGKITSDIVGISMMGTPLTYKFSMQGVWLWLLLVLLISTIASIIPARNATRLTVREVLAYE